MLRAWPGTISGKTTAPDPRRHRGGGALAGACAGVRRRGDQLARRPHAGAGPAAGRGASRRLRRRRRARRFLAERAIDRLVDATHPFAAQIGAHAELACREAGVPRLRLLRPPWPGTGRPLARGRRPGRAAPRLPALGRRAFLTVGHKELAASRASVCGSWSARSSRPARCRCARPVARRARAVRVADELALLREHPIDVLVTKASGGDATYAKLAAARQLGLPVIMVRRPPPPPGPVVDSVAARSPGSSALTHVRPPGAARGGGRGRRAGCRRILGASARPTRISAVRVMPRPFIRAADRGERAADDPLVRPGGAVHHDGRAVGAAHRRQLAHDPREVVDREMDRERRAGRGERRQRLAGRHRRGAHRGARQDHRLRDPRAASAPARAPRRRRRTPARPG